MFFWNVKRQILNFCSTNYINFENPYTNIQNLFFSFFEFIKLNIFAHIKKGDTMKQKSIWLEGFPKDICSSLDKDLDIDVLIIGGGITGLNTAYHLINQNLKVALVEKNNIGCGVTSRTTGKLTYLQENLFSKIKSYHGSYKAQLYMQSQIDATNLVKNIIEKEKIECDLECTKSYIFSDDIKKIENEEKVLTEAGILIHKASKLPNGESITAGFYVDNTYVFHPLKYVYGLKDICLKNNISIYERTKVISIDKNSSGYICKTDHCSIHTKYIVLALHYPYFVTPFWMPLKAHIEKSYLQAFQVEKNYKFSAITISKPTISMRYHTDKDKNYQLYLTNAHNACIKNNEKKNFDDLLKAKNKQPDYLWSNKDIITIDSLPYIGAINDDNTILIGTGYNTWGMTNGSLAGKILSDIILKKDNKYIELFQPKRKMNIGKIVNFPMVLGSNAYSFIKTKLKKQKDWYPSYVRFETRNGEKIAIYTDEQNKEHIVHNICPHFKCSLIFNEIEKTWDCPCHGSRFDIDGNSIEGPSNYNITYKNL